MELTQKDIQHYSDRSIHWLVGKAQFYFNKWVRERSQKEGLGCCSCDSREISQASHLYSAGHYPSLRFEPDNVWASCKRCNLFLHGNIQEYRLRLIKRIGIERVEALDNKVAIYNRTKYKMERLYLIEKIIHYRKLLSENK